MSNRIFAKGGFEFRLVKDENGEILSQFRFKALFFWWGKWHDWFFCPNAEYGMKELLRIKDKYDGKIKKIRTPI